MTADGDRLPTVTIERFLQWPDTDASGHQHHSVVMRWVEEAEAALLAERGLSGQFGYTPRVRYQVDYSARLWFGDPVEVELAVLRIGRSSLTYQFQVHGPRGSAAAGEMTIVHTATSTGASTPWPETVRAALMRPEADPELAHPQGRKSPSNSPPM